MLLSDNDNKLKIYDLSKKGIEINKPIDIIKDPYVFEFLGPQEKNLIYESDLEKALLIEMEKFLLELGRGLCL